MAMFGHTVKTMAAALVVMAPLVAMTLPAGAGPALHKKQPIAQKIAPKPATSTERPAFNAEDQERAIIPGFPDARFWGDSEKDFLQATRGTTGPWLALSAGGADGAFGAGLLSGLSASGQRPDFTVVTGVSTGALIAPLVFIGARQDEILRKVYTTINADDIFELARTPGHCERRSKSRCSISEEAIKSVAAETTAFFEPEMTLDGHLSFPQETHVLIARQYPCNLFLARSRHRSRRSRTPLPGLSVDRYR